MANKLLQSVVERRVLTDADGVGKHFVSSLEPLSAAGPNGDVDNGGSSEAERLLGVAGGFSRWYRLAVAYMSLVQLCRRLDIIFHLDGCCLCAASICDRSRSSDSGGSMMDESVELSMRSRDNARSLDDTLAGGGDVSKTIGEDGKSMKAIQHSLLRTKSLKKQNRSSTRETHRLFNVTCTGARA